MIPSLTLHDGVEVPQLGFGVFQVPPEDTQQVVEEALAAGYRHIDTAAAYRNEKGVGAAIAASGIPRDEVFVTTKLWNSQQGFDSTLEAIEKSLGRLGMERVDLYLIHWPAPPQDLFVETWKAFERIRGEGRSRTIGVSNFRIEDLERLERETETVPTVNQVELHPRFQQAELRAWHAEHGIATEAWSPLGQGHLLDEERDRRDRRAPRPHAGAGDPALAPAARQRRHPQVGHPGADPREHRGLRLRAQRGGDGRVRGDRHRQALRPRPRRTSFAVDRPVDRRALRKRGLLRLVDAELSEATAWVDRNTARRLRRVNAVAATAFVLGGSLFAIGAALAQLGSRADALLLGLPGRWDLLLAPAATPPSCRRSTGRGRSARTAGCCRGTGTGGRASRIASSG